jgi:hypothetical protein
MSAMNSASTDHFCVGPVPQTSAPSDPEESFHFNQYGASLHQRHLYAERSSSIVFARCASTPYALAREQN